MESSTSSDNQTQKTTVQETKMEKQHQSGTNSLNLKERGIKYSPSRSDEYATLRRLAYFCKFLSWCVAVSSLPFIWGVFNMLGTASSKHNDLMTQIVAGLGIFPLILVIIAILLVFVFFGILAEIVLVQLDTEANTRETANLLQKQLRSLSDNENNEE